MAIKNYGMQQTICLACCFACCAFMECVCHCVMCASAFPHSILFVCGRLQNSQQLKFWVIEPCCTCAKLYVVQKEEAADSQRPQEEVEVDVWGNALQLWTLHCWIWTLDSTLKGNRCIRTNLLVDQDGPGRRCECTLCWVEGPLIPRWEAASTTLYIPGACRGPHHTTCRQCRYRPQPSLKG